MAEEGYGIQISLRRGDDMLNVRGSDTDELLQILTNLMDAAKDDDLAAWLVDTFQVGEKPKARSSSSSTLRSSSRGSSRSSSNGGEPSEKQLAFARRLKVRGYKDMDKSEISAAIDEALAAQEEDDDDD